MNGIGYDDVESYVRTLVIEGFGKQFQSEMDKTSQSGEPPSKEQPSVSDQPVNNSRTSA